MELTSEIIEAYLFLGDKSILETRQSGKLLWLKLFTFYNNNQEPGKTPLSQNCGPCYPKVLQFVANKIIKKKRAESELKVNEFRSQNIV